MTKGNGAAEGMNDWLEGLPPEFRPLALKHGKELFAFVISIGQANHATQLLAKRTRGNNEQAHALMMLAGAAQNFANGLHEAKGWTQEQIVQVQKDIELTAALGLVGEEGRSKGGIILAN